jgi:hypothetical protein
MSIARSNGHRDVVTALGALDGRVEGVATLGSLQVVFNSPLLGGFQRASDIAEGASSDDHSITFHAKFDARADGDEGAVHVSAPHPGAQDGRALSGIRLTLHRILHRPVAGSGAQPSRFRVCSCKRLRMALR